MNECLNQSVCGRGRCVNTEGSYRCNCFQGYKLSPDNVCQGICQSEDRSDIIHTPCQSYISVSSFPQGSRGSLAVPLKVYLKKRNLQRVRGWLYFLFSPYDFSPDVDECLLPGVCLNGRCVNLDGTYRCTCNHGYQVTSDSKSCEGLQRII